MRVLVAGGAGFTGSQTCQELAEHCHEVVIADNFWLRGVEAFVIPIFSVKLELA